MQSLRCREEPAFLTWSGAERVPHADGWGGEVGTSLMDRGNMGRSVHPQGRAWALPAGNTPNPELLNWAFCSFKITICSFQKFQNFRVKTSPPSSLLPQIHTLLRRRQLLTPWHESFHTPSHWFLLSLQKMGFVYGFVIFKIHLAIYHMCFFVSISDFLYTGFFFSLFTKLEKKGKEEKKVNKEASYKLKDEPHCRPRTSAFWESAHSVLCGGPWPGSATARAAFAPRPTDAFPPWSSALPSAPVAVCASEAEPQVGPPPLHKQRNSGVEFQREW